METWTERRAADGPYRPIRHNLGEERLDWQGFLARFFPDSRRHDFDALAAYESYRNDAEADARAPSTTQSGEDEQEPPSTADTERWEGDGGASAARPRRRGRGERPVGRELTA